MLKSSFVSCACVYSEHGTAGEPGAVAGVSGRWRVEGGLSAVAVFVARRRVFIETRGRHEWVLSGLLVWSRAYYARVCEGRFGVQNNIQAVLIFATKIKFTERAPQSDHHNCRAGERGPR